MNPLVVRAWCASCGDIRGYPAPLPALCPTHKTKLCDLSSPPRAGSASSIRFSADDLKFLRSLRIAVD